MLTCLQIIQTVCKRVGIVSPNSAIGSTDQQIIQLVSLSEEEGQEQAKRYPWQVLQGEATFTTVAAQVQGNMDTIAPGWDYIVNDTIWNRSLRRPVYGPRSPQDWQQQKAMQINGPFNSFRIIGGQINFYPARLPARRAHLNTSHGTGSRTRRAAPLPYGRMTQTFRYSTTGCSFSALAGDGSRLRASTIPRTTPRMSVRLPTR
jgi:hypothetical protein